MNQSFTEVHILPSYAKGFTFMWEISQGFSDPLPWAFRVEEGPTAEGPWSVISPPVLNMFAWVETTKRIVNKDLVLFFRVTLTTPKGTYYSHIKTPYGDLGRREYLLVRDIMRREVLQQDTLSGIQGRLWIRSTSGARCTNCVDPITGDNVSSNCRECLGTGRVPPYHGPYTVWMTFSPTNRDTEQKPDGTGTQQIYVWNIRLIGFPYAKDQDIAIDIATDKRYVIDGVQHLTEIRRIPVVQNLRARELPVSDPAYRLGTGLEDEDCVLP